MIVKYSVNPYIFTIVLLFNYVVFAMYNPLQAVFDPYKGYSDQEMYFLVHNGGSIPWIISVNNCKLYSNISETM